MLYTKEYYEEGVAKGISGYTNYRWIPEFTIPLAHRIIKRLNLQPNDLVLDYGCAKGFLVKALRLLDIDAYGCDISQYAIDCVDKETEDYCVCGEWHDQYQKKYNWVIAKDVLEHLTVTQLVVFENQCTLASNGIFIVVPLGDGNKYEIPQYEDDVTHIIRQPSYWWRDFFLSRGWDVECSLDVTGIKDSWAHYPLGNAILTCRKRAQSP